MALNPHLTDQLAAGTRDARHADGCVVPDSVAPLIERLVERLPGIDRQLLGEILLHTAHAADAMAVQLTRRGHPAEVIEPTVTATLAEAGGRLYRGERC